jgi:hypothetical protein
MDLDNTIFNTPEFLEALKLAPEENREEMLKVVKTFANEFYEQVIKPLEEHSKTNN